MYIENTVSILVKRGIVTTSDPDQLVNSTEG